ncbi:MAG: hypothetical protein JO332_20145 [Planctomycetaceae bacterium]|nr:hypothetical protein [Planctomycetaceae bacterium]
MSIRSRSVLGAVAFFGGLLLIAYAGVAKSSERIQFERDVQRGQADPSRPPSKAGLNVLMIVGSAASVVGVVVIGLATRDMFAQIGSASESAEQRLQRELMNPRDPKPKP